MPKATYILLFRGVGGATQIPTAPLRESLAGAGFENVAADINSGNAVLRGALSREEVVAEAARICAGRVGFAKAVHAPTPARRSRSRGGSRTCTRRPASGGRSWARSSTGGSAWRTRPATGTRSPGCWG